MPLQSEPEWERDADEAFRRFPPGTRVEYVGPADPSLTDAQPGERGTVMAVQRLGDLVLNWDRCGGEVWDRPSWDDLRPVED